VLRTPPKGGFVASSSEPSNGTSVFEQSLTGTGDGSGSESGSDVSVSEADVRRANLTPRYGRADVLERRMSQQKVAIEYRPFWFIPSPPVSPFPGGHVALWYTRRGWCIGEISLVREGESNEHKKRTKAKGEKAGTKPLPVYYVAVKVGGELSYMQFYEDGTCDTDPYVILDAPDVPSSMDLCNMPGGDANAKKRQDRGDDAGCGGDLGKGRVQSPAVKRCKGK
jgi:hypothetical protein